MSSERSSRPRLAWAAILATLGATATAGAQVAEQPREHIRTWDTLDSLHQFVMYQESGWRLMSRGKFDSAEREFAAAVKVAKRPHITDPRLLARGYSALAWALQQQNRLREAEPLARWALDTRIAQFGPNGEPVARSLNQVAMIYLATDRFAAAEPLLRQVLAMDGGASEVIENEQAQSESLMGLGLVAQRRYAEGEGAFERAVAIRKEAQGLKHPELGDELNNLAWAQIEQGKLTEARATMNQAVKIIRQNRGDADVSVARALDGLARIDTEEKQYPQAEVKYRRLISIYEQLGAGEQARLDAGLKQYANLLDQMGRADDAARTRARLAGSRPSPPGVAANDSNFAPPAFPKTPVTPPGRP